jgi:hypothetical protein
LVAFLGALAFLVVVRALPVRCADDLLDLAAMVNLSVDR